MINVAKNSQKKQINVIAVAETSQQRQAFADTIHLCGLNLVDCLSEEEFQKQGLIYEVDLLLIDSLYEQEIIEMVENGQVKCTLVGFNQAPYSNDKNNYEKWQRKLKRKLAKILNMPELIDKKIYDKETKDWKYVVFLGASMGGPSAVKEFLDNLSPELPICLLLAHHYENNRIHTLPQILTRQNDWQCQVIETSQSLQVGRCLIAPVKEKIICNSYGKIFLTKDVWEGGYNPSIDQLMLNASDVYGELLINIIFSGMADDGSAYLQQIHNNGSQIWVQDPASCISVNQPQAVIDSGLCEFIGTPQQLANKLTEFVTANN